MTETTTNPTATIDESVLNSTQQDMLKLMRDAVADAERAKPTADKRTVNDVFLSLCLDGTNDDVQGLEDFRKILQAKASQVFAAESANTDELSDDERKKIRTEAKAQYAAAENVLNLMGGVPEGFVLPTFPGARSGSSAGVGAGGEKPRNLKSTITKDGEDKPTLENVTFSVIGNKVGVPTAELLDGFKAVAGASKDEWENGPGSWAWAFSTSNGAITYNVVTTYNG